MERIVIIHKFKPVAGMIRHITFFASETGDRIAISVGSYPVEFEEQPHPSIYGNFYTLNLSPEEFDKFLEILNTFKEELKRRGHLIE